MRLAFLTLSACAVSPVTLGDQPFAAGPDATDEGTADDGGTDSDTDGEAPTDDSTDGEDSTDSTDVPCEFPKYDAHPSDGGAMHYRAFVWLKTEDPEQLSVEMRREDDGALVPWEATADGDEVWFQPLAPLVPSTEYRVTLTHRCGEDSFAVFTRETGLRSDLSMDSWRNDLTSPDISAYWGQWTAPLEVRLVSSSEGQLELGLLTEGQECSEEWVAATTVWANPYFEVPAELSLFPGGVSHVVVSGDFSPDSSYIDGLGITGTVHFGALAPAMCDVYACGPCADGLEACAETSALWFPAESSATTCSP
jgi:hypothetical protein